MLYDVTSHGYLERIDVNDVLIIVESWRLQGHILLPYTRASFWI